LEKKVFIIITLMLVFGLSAKLKKLLIKYYKVVLLLAYCDISSCWFYAARSI